MAKVVGLVNLHSNVDLKGLTERRPVASVSFLGRFLTSLIHRLIM